MRDKKCKLSPMNEDKKKAILALLRRALAARRKKDQGGTDVPIRRYSGGIYKYAAEEQMRGLVESWLYRR